MPHNGNSQAAPANTLYSLGAKEQVNTNEPIEDAVALTQLPPSTVKYRFISIHRIGAFNRVPRSLDGSSQQQCAIDLDVADAKAFLTQDASAAWLAIDRNTAVGCHLLFGSDVKQNATSFLGAIEAKAIEIAANRQAKLPRASVFLVIEAVGEIATPELHPVRDLGDAVVALDAVDKEALCAQNQNLVETVVSSVALSIGRYADIELLVDGVTLTLPDGRPLYSATFTGHGTALASARPATLQEIAAIEQNVSLTLSEPRLTTALRLIVHALRSREDRIEAFLLAWAALEMVIKKFTTGCRLGCWIDSLPDAKRESARNLHANYVREGHKDYSLGQRVRAFSLLYGIQDDELATEINQIQKEFREPLYHQGVISSVLPVERVVSITLQLVQAALSVKRAIQHETTSENS